MKGAESLGPQDWGLVIRYSRATSYRTLNFHAEEGKGGEKEHLDKNAWKDSPWRMIPPRFICSPATVPASAAELRE